jgi:hypothetical protein
MMDATSGTFGSSASEKHSEPEDRENGQMALDIRTCFVDDETQCDGETENVSSLTEPPRIVLGKAFPLEKSHRVIVLPSSAEHIMKSADRLIRELKSFASLVFPHLANQMRVERGLDVDENNARVFLCLLLIVDCWKELPPEKKQRFHDVLRAFVEKLKTKSFEVEQPDKASPRTTDNDQVGKEPADQNEGLGDLSSGDAASIDPELSSLADHAVEACIQRNGSLTFGENAVFELAGKKICLPAKTRERNSEEPPPSGLVSFSGVVDFASYRSRHCRIVEDSSGHRAKSRTYRFLIEDHLPTLLDAERQQLVVCGKSELNTLTGTWEIRGRLTIQESIFERFSA